MHFTHGELRPKEEALNALNHSWPKSEQGADSNYGPELFLLYLLLPLLWGSETETDDDGKREH